MAAQLAIGRPADGVVDGMIVFEGLSSFEFVPQGFVPSDWIEFVSIDQMCEVSRDKPHFRATFATDAILLARARGSRNNENAREKSVRHPGNPLSAGAAKIGSLPLKSKSTSARK